MVSFTEGLSSAGSRVKRDGGFGSFEGGESGGLNNLLLLSLLQQMAASSPPAAAAPAPAAGAEARKNFPVSHSDFCSTKLEYF